MVPFHHSYYNYTPSINPPRVQLISLKFNYKIVLLYYDASGSVIPLNKMTQVKCTKYWLDKLAIIKKTRKKINPTYISEVALNKNLFKETGRCVVQPSSMDSIAIVVKPTNSDSVIAFVLGITSNMNPIHDLKFHSLKNSLPKNENEAFDKLIIPFLMTSLTKVEHDKIRTSKRVIFDCQK